MPPNEVLERIAEGQLTGPDLAETLAVHGLFVSTSDCQIAVIGDHWWTVRVLRGVRREARGGGSTEGKAIVDAIRQLFD